MATYDYNWIGETIRKSDFYNYHAYRHVWISGSSTPVKPITIFPEDQIREIDIDIQVNSMMGKGCYARFRRMLKRLQSRYPRMEGRFCKMDGSCPDYYAITVWKEGWNPKEVRA